MLDQSAIRKVVLKFMAGEPLSRDEEELLRVVQSEVLVRAHSGQ